MNLGDPTSDQPNRKSIMKRIIAFFGKILSFLAQAFASSPV
jgi:hypothetical protein